MGCAAPAGTCKSATEVRDHLVKFIDNDDGIFIIKSAGKAAWLVAGGDFSLYNENDQNYQSGSWPDGDSREINDR